MWRILANRWRYGIWTRCRHARLALAYVEVAPAPHSGQPFSREYWTLCVACRAILFRSTPEGVEAPRR